MFDWKNETYLIFLHPRFFRKSIFNILYKRVVKNLENKGIKVVSIDAIIDYQKDNNNLLFDDKEFPDTNQLYIHLFNGNYYNDSIYCKKKLEKEREMLLLLAGKLGVREINYTVEEVNTVINKVDSSVKVKNINISVNYDKSVTSKKSDTLKESYSNRGASDYILSSNFEQLEKTFINFPETIFSFDLYKLNAKLETFVYKRFNFKMTHLEYVIETEDISDISFAVKTCFIENGINLAIQNNNIVRQIVNYSFDFYTDNELRLELFKQIQRETDRFTLIREIYDESNDKISSLNYITEYVKELSKKCFYKEEDIEKNCYDILINWISDNKDKFKNKCQNFITTDQIKNWIYELLSKITNEINKDQENFYRSCTVEENNTEPINKPILERRLSNESIKKEIKKEKIIRGRELGFFRQPRAQSATMSPSAIKLVQKLK